jgi:CRISPR-associated protein Cas6
MYWQENKTDQPFVPSDDVVDVAFRIVCRSLPVDHAYALAQAVGSVLPWLTEDETAGVHTIHVAESGNGWMRPETADAVLYLSRRTRLVLRLPKHRVKDAQALSGKTLLVGRNPMQVEAAAVRPLAPSATVFSRYIVSPGAQDEAAFLAETARTLAALGIQARKMLCGIERVIATPERAIHTRSLMIAELAPAESVTLQQRGLGPLRHLGCGLFVPHKDIREVKDGLD